MIKRRKSHRETSPDTTQFAQHLRRTMTPAERILWAHLRRDCLDYHFRRQAPIGKYILGFYCVNARLVIEVDGDVHAEQPAMDLERSNWLNNRKRIRVIRVTNQDVIENIGGVLQYILQELASTPSSAPR